MGGEWGEQVVSVVQLHAGVEPTPGLGDELRTYCREWLAGYKCPRRVEFDHALPRSYTGKLYRRRLRERYLDAGTVGLSPPAGSSPPA